MKIKSWISAIRLRTLPLSLSCILMSGALANLIYPIDVSIFILIITTTILLQVLSNLANDYGDGLKGTDDHRVGPERMIQKGLISKKEMFFGICILGILTFLMGLLLLYKVFGLDYIMVSLSFLLLGIFSIWAAIKYTMGNNPYGYKGLGDLFVFIFFGLVGVIGSFYLLTLSWNWITIPGSLFTGCLSMAVLNMNNMRDHDTDKEAGKKTLVVKYGLKWASKYQIALITISIISIFSIIIFSNDFWNYLCLIPLPYLISNINKVINYKNTLELDKELKKIALSTFAISFILFVKIIIIN